MLSFIVIGKNESVRIYNCINSILNFINFNNLKNHEIIYVDSESKDDSIEMASSFNNVKIIKLVGDLNAAVARNEGAKMAKGDFLYFIDGDMEITNNFYEHVFDKEGKLIYDFVSGEFVSYYYSGGSFVSSEPYHNIVDDTFEPTTGGIFIINKLLWVELDGMKLKYKRCQDIDFGLRMSSRGIQLLRKKNIIAIHHTVSYYEHKRLWTDLFNFNQLYQKSVLYRDHALNPFIWRYVKREISLFSLLLSFLLYLVSLQSFFLLIFPIFILVKSLYKYDNGVSKNILISYSYYFLLDVFVFFGFLFFWPNNNKIYSVQQDFTL
jgi:glycosyltransferase involved in cell wall biosynthesis